MDTCIKGCRFKKQDGYDYCCNCTSECEECDRMFHIKDLTADPNDYMPTLCYDCAVMELESIKGANPIEKRSNN